jgi:hypothetical protein
MRISRLFTVGTLAATVALLAASPASAALFSSSTGLSTSPNPSCTGRTVTLTARVSAVTTAPLEPIPGGTVDFVDQGSVLRTVPLDGNGYGRFSISSLSVASHQITARYSGDFWYDPSASGAVTQRVVAPCGGAGGGGGGGSGGAGAKAPPPPPLIAAAGDIACGTNNPRYNRGLGSAAGCQQLWTSNLLADRGLSAVLPLGDLQYDGGGTLESFLGSYAPTWGRWRTISHPAIGNHEYDDQQGGEGYWDYWNGAGVRNGRAGHRHRGWYSFDRGSWHLVALNSNCDIVSCRAHSRQLKWLRKNLRHSKGHCVLAYMHHPHFSSGLHEEYQDTGRLWNALYRLGADVVLNGHDHIYERFAPQRPSGVLDRRRGISEFTVGTGGYYLFSIRSPRVAHSQFATADTYGVLFMRLEQRSFGWSFVNVSGQAVDEGQRPCHPAWPRRRHRHHHGHHHRHRHHHG